MATPSSSLGTINSTTLGAKTPEITLSDGRKVQTGTVGALLINIKEYDRICTSPEHCNVKDEARLARQQLLEDAIKAALPTLHNVGFFDLFSAEEWTSGPGAQDGTSPGRRFAGLEAIKMGY